MSNISRMPGAACIYYHKGRCLYEEKLNPGLDRTIRCKVILACEAEFDHFLAQADIFEIPPAAASRILDNRLDRLLFENKVCADYKPENKNIEAGEYEEVDSGIGFVDCVHAHGALCLLALPLCTGICSRYKLRP